MGSGRFPALLSSPNPQLFNYKQEITLAACASPSVVGRSDLWGQITTAWGFMLRYRKQLEYLFPCSYTYMHIDTVVFAFSFVSLYMRREREMYMHTRYLLP